MVLPVFSGGHVTPGYHKIAKNVLNWQNITRLPQYSWE